MKKKSNADIFAAVVGKAIATEIVSLIIIFIFTKSLIYCIISITGASISIIGFVLLIKSTDRMLKKGKGKVMFFLLAQMKLLIIAGIFFVFSRLTKTGIIFYIQGIAVVYLAIMIEGLLFFGGRVRNGT
ncbi:MAG: hypothetical protein JXI33_05895 [Candidatus Aminicenantes bacterium]|nr:hypothetical protein [Candidatus Aminicenantes bacterium]